ncbi:MAG: hypothetical protein IT423_02230, partial [Pirellulaceae bacterium]|nr:hypothetical protein [Pirellulaceae bacterium]
MKNRPFWLVLSLAVTLWTSPATQLSAQIPGQLTAAKTIPPPTAPAQAADQPILATDLICVVGGDRILAGDVFAYIEPIIEENRKSIPPGQEDMVRRQLMRKMLSQYVQVKAMYQDFIS